MSRAVLVNVIVHLNYFSVAFFDFFFFFIIISLYVILVLLLPARFHLQIKALKTSILFKNFYMFVAQNGLVWIIFFFFFIQLEWHVSSF